MRCSASSKTSRASSRRPARVSTSASAIVASLQSPPSSTARRAAAISCSGSSCQRWQAARSSQILGRWGNLPEASRATCSASSTCPMWPSCCVRADHACHRSGLSPCARRSSASSESLSSTARACSAKVSRPLPPTTWCTSALSTNASTCLRSASARDSSSSWPMASSLSTLSSIARRSSWRAASCSPTLARQRPRIELLHELRGSMLVASRAATTASAWRCCRSSTSASSRSAQPLELSTRNSSRTAASRSADPSSRLHSARSCSRPTLCRCREQACTRCSSAAAGLSRLDSARAKDRCRSMASGSASSRERAASRAPLKSSAPSAMPSAARSQSPSAPGRGADSSTSRDFSTSPHSARRVAARSRSSPLSGRRAMALSSTAHAAPGWSICVHAQARVSAGWSERAPKRANRSSRWVMASRPLRVRLQAMNQDWYRCSRKLSRVAAKRYSSVASSKRASSQYMSASAQITDQSIRRRRSARLATRRASGHSRASSRSSRA